MINPRKHGCPRDPAHVFTVKVGEADSPLGKRIETRGTDFPPVTTEIGIAHVCHDDEDIGPLSGGTIDKGND